MGLQAHISAEGFPQEVSVSLHLSGGFATTVSVPVDYSPALEAAQEAFMEVATALVPVDTGYLKSSIHAKIAGLDLEMFADAEYAGYVEYGTWKMMAQPYFEPAISAAGAAFSAAAQLCLQQAYEEISEIVAGFNMSDGSIDALQDQVWGAAGMPSGMSMLGTIIGGIIAGIITTTIQAITGHDFTGNSDN